MPHDDQSELFCLVDADDQVLGSVTRAKAHADKSQIHRAVDVLVLDQDGQKILLQKRSMHKDTCPGFWAVSASGHVTYGQSYEEAALRELAEELGIELALSYVGKQFFDTDTEQEFSAIFTAEYDDQALQIDESEVSEVRWVALDELADFVRDNQVTPASQQVMRWMGYILF